MTVLYRRVANYGAFILIVAAPLTAAFRLPYLLSAACAIAGVALVIGGNALLRQRTERALQALASAAGSPVREHQEEESAAWLRELGFADFSRQVIRRLRVRSAEAAGGTASFAEIRLGPGKPTTVLVAVISARTRIAGALCLRAKTRGEAGRARSIGGRVDTGTPLDEHFVVYADDAEAARATAVSLDAEAVGALFRRVRAMGGSEEIALAIAPGRASVLVEGAPAELFSPDTARELAGALSSIVRAPL